MEQPAFGKTMIVTSSAQNPEYNKFMSALESSKSELAQYKIQIFENKLPESSKNFSISLHDSQGHMLGEVSQFTDFQSLISLYNEVEPAQTGGAPTDWEAKYYKYKAKYMRLAKEMSQ